MNKSKPAPCLPRRDVKTQNPALFDLFEDDTCANPQYVSSRD